MKNQEEKLEVYGDDIDREWIYMLEDKLVWVDGIDEKIIKRSDFNEVIETLEEFKRKCHKPNSIKEIIKFFDQQFPIICECGEENCSMSRPSVHKFLEEKLLQVRAEGVEEGKKEDLQKMSDAIEFSKIGWVDQGRIEERDRIRKALPKKLNSNKGGGYFIEDTGETIYEKGFNFGFNECLNKIKKII